jgi:small-conductance mechanosensitive channel
MGNSASGWSPERRQRQRQAIKEWKPWSQSTGPQSAAGKAQVSQNAYKGGLRDKLQELKRDINEEIREARDRLNLIKFK